MVEEAHKLLHPPDGELHGVRLLHTSRGIMGMRQLIRALLMVYCAPICQIIEKRFLLAVTLYEFYLDVRFNKNTPTSIDNDWEQKHVFGEAVYRLPDDLLTQFAQTHSSLDKQLVLETLRDITRALTLQSDDDLASLLIGSIPYIDDIIDYHKFGRTHFDSITLNAPNVASFHMFFHSLEQIGREAEIPRLTLIHDENPQFQNTFQKVFEHFRDDPRDDSYREGPWSQVFLGFRSLKDLRFANSKNEPLLQAADIFTCMLHKYAVNIYKGIPNSPTLTEVAGMFLKEPPECPAIVRIITSDQFCTKLKTFK